MSKDKINSKEFLKKFKAKLFTSMTGEATISLIESDQTKTFYLGDSQWRNWLIRYTYSQKMDLNEYKRNAFTDELIALSSMKDEKITVYVRTAFHEGDIVIDLNRDDYKCVRINKKGFQVIDQSPVPFVRPTKQQPMPIPEKIERAKFIEHIKSLAPKDNTSWILLLAYLLKCLHRDQGGYPLLVLGGPQGSGKTTLSNRLKMLIDPSSPSSYSPPNSTDDIIVASVHSYLMVYDNISGLDYKMADTFCRIATGSGISKRKHYENHGEAFYFLFSPVLINGIDEPSNRADFVDRSITIELKPLADKNRESEVFLDKAFKKQLPYLLGGLYSLMADCLSVLDDVQNHGLPRMAEYARMGIALEKVLGLEDGAFLKAHRRNKREQLDNTFWNDDLCAAIYKKLTKASTLGQELPTGVYEDTAAGMGRTLLKDYKRTLSAKAFTGWLKRIEPLLKERYIFVERLPRTSTERLIRISLEPPKNDN